MRQINPISDQATQQILLGLDDGTLAKVTMRFLPAIRRWKLSVEYKGRAFGGSFAVVSPNLLRNWRNLIPFGIACTSTDGLDPFQKDDFSTGRTELFLLDSADVSHVETEIIGGPR